MLAKGPQHDINFPNGELIQKIIEFIVHIILMALFMKSPKVKHEFHNLNKNIRLNVLKKSFAPGLVRPKDKIIVDLVFLSRFLYLPFENELGREGTPSSALRACPSPRLAQVNEHTHVVYVCLLVVEE